MEISWRPSKNMTRSMLSRLLLDDIDDKLALNVARFVKHRASPTNKPFDKTFGSLVTNTIS
jgi:hypothetical protein